MKLFSKLFGNRQSGMRLQSIIEQAYMQPMLITPEGFAAVHQMIQSKLAGEPIPDFKSRSDDGTEYDLFGDPLPVMEVDNKIAYIPIIGPISYSISRVERVIGVCDLADVKRNVKLAKDDDQIEGMVLDVSSYGGFSTHVEETAAVIAEAARIKPVLAFTDTIAASAAYYLIGSTEIYATPSARVGGIGTYMALLDSSKLYERVGLKVDLFVGHNAKYKGMGTEGKSLSVDQKALLQSTVDNMTTQFKGFVKQHRPQVVEEAMMGQTLSGKQAVEMGLVDQLIGDIEELILQ
jgi:signal peptide peptidase SppA